MDCIFCKIVNKEIPSDVLWENDKAFVILDINPHAPGHAMVIPKSHRETVLDLAPDEIEPLFSLMKETTERLKRSTLAPEGFTIGINHGVAAGQAVAHLHVHIIPRYGDDGGGSVHSVVKNPPKVSLEEIAKKIRES